MGKVELDRRFKSDHIFNDVSRLFITLKDEEMKEYNVHLKTVLDQFIEHMRRGDPMFNACYQKVVYVGSYYEGLKVGKPEEFDLNIVIKLPIPYNALTTLIATERHGYIKVKANPDVLVNLRKHPRWQDYRYYSQRNAHKNSEVDSNSNRTPNGDSAAKSRAASHRRRRFRKKIMDSWFDENDCLDQNKFRQWFESVTTKALGNLDYVDRKYVSVTTATRYHLHHKKSGPAWTLKIDVPNGHTLDVDLVPVLEFTTGPSKPFLSHNTKKPNWFAISKPLVGPSNNILWRPSFYERELDILKGSIKQIIRQMKKLRDTQNFKSIASYYIKTLFLHELDKQKSDPEFQKLPSTFLFFYMLKKLHEACTKHEILDFWNPKNNLLGNISPDEMGNIKCRLANIIKAIDKRITEDPYVIAEFILTENELKQLQLEREPKNVVFPGAMYPGNTETTEMPRSRIIFRETTRMTDYRDPVAVPVATETTKLTDYIVPVAIAGTLAITAAALYSFFSDQGGTGSAETEQASRRNGRSRNNE